MSDDPRIGGPKNSHSAAGGLVPAGTVPSQRCTAHRSNGEPCKRWAIVGGLVCPTHGGSAPQVRRAAFERIISQAPAAVQTLVRNMGPGAPAAVQVRAADSLLDRAGLKSPDVSVTVEATQEQANAALDDALSKVLRSRGFDVPEAIDVEATEDDD